MPSSLIEFDYKKLEERVIAHMKKFEGEQEKQANKLITDEFKENLIYSGTVTGRFTVKKDKVTFCIIDSTPTRVINLFYEHFKHIQEQSKSEFTIVEHPSEEKINEIHRVFDNIQVQNELDEIPKRNYVRPQRTSDRIRKKSRIRSYDNFRSKNNRRRIQRNYRNRRR
jgi:hypothetical protein